MFTLFSDDDDDSESLLLKIILQLLLLLLERRFITAWLKLIVIKNEHVLKN